MAGKNLIASIEQIKSQIFLIHGQKVMLDEDLAALYEVETKALNRAVKRNLDRFPEDFMFQLSADELTNLRCQSGTSRWGGRRYPPYAFTEQGVSMLSSVLHSARAIHVNIEIMRAFVRLRQMLASNIELWMKQLAIRCHPRAHDATGTKEKTPHWFCAVERKMMLIYPALPYATQEET